MKIQVLLYVGLCGLTVFAKPQGYLPSHSPTAESEDSNEQVNEPPSVIITEPEVTYERPANLCKDGQVLHVDGTCAFPIITRNIAIYEAPVPPQEYNSQPPSIPPPKVNHNIIFVHVPVRNEPEPIVIPPPRQQNIVYVLSKNNGESEKQRVIEVTTPPSTPEVHFVNYKDGENPQLNIGVDLETALKAAEETSGSSNDNISSAGLTQDAYGNNGDNSVSGLNGSFGFSFSRNVANSESNDESEFSSQSVVSSATNSYGPPPSANIYSAP